MLGNSVLRLDLFCFVAARRRLSTFTLGGQSRQDVGDDVAVHIGEAEVAVSVAVGQSFVVQPAQMQDGGVQIVHRADVRHSMDTKLIFAAIFGSFG
jgi:hypothetical protein